MSLVNAGNVQDIWSTLKCNEDKYNIIQLQQEIAKEQNGKNRKTVIEMLNAAIKRKNKSKLIIEDHEG